MASDELIWKILDQKFCSYKMKNPGDEQKICRHPMNVNGLCRQTYCPLANSKYATVIEKKGKLMLCIKTPERQHLPNKWWEKIELDKNHEKALEQIQAAMQWWPKNEIHRCKKRYLRLIQVLRRMRRLRNLNLPKLLTFQKKVERRLKSREESALRMAKLETSIEQQLLQRLRSGFYKDLYKITNKEEEKQDELEVEEEPEFVEDVDEEEEEEEDVSDAEVELEEEQDIEDILDEYERKFDKSSGKKRARNDSDDDEDDDSGTTKKPTSDEDSDDEDKKLKTAIKRVAKRKRGNMEIEYEQPAKSTLKH